MSQKIKLSVIIPTLNRPEDLSGAVISILSQTVLPYELIIVDQSADKFSYNNIHTIFSKRNNPCSLVYIHDSSIVGLVSAKHKGVQNSSGNIISFLEDDETLNKDYFKNIISIFTNNENLLGCSGVVSNIRRNKIYSLAFKIFHLGIFFDNRVDIIKKVDIHQEALLIESNHISGGLSSYRKSVFDDIKYDLKNDFFYCEDIDFSIRAADFYGKDKFYLATNVLLQHHLSPINRDSMLPRWSRKTKEFIMLYKKNSNKPYALFCIFWLLIGLLIESMYSSLRRLSIAPLIGYFKGLVLGLKTKLILDVNLDHETVKGFGEEWDYFDQSSLNTDEKSIIFNDYFGLFPWEKLPENAIGFDLGCGSGRWAILVAEKVGYLHCIDPSEKALNVAKKNLSAVKNVDFMLASVDSIPFENNSQDFGYSLGVLHHIPDTAAALQSCVNKLKPGAPFLVYLYYSFDNRSLWYRILWKLTDLLRRIIYVLPEKIKRLITDFIALSVYFSLARLSHFIELIGLNSESLPLSYYKDKSFYTMRTDARDRFGTALESRFSKKQVMGMMSDAGLVEISFSKSAPFWCAIGTKK